MFVFLLVWLISISIASCRLSYQISGGSDIKVCQHRDIYHCPYCNLCRVGRGLGIDYYHCMNCNACMSRTLLGHVCREKSFMDNCPICHEDFFTSSSPVKALPCGHLMHSNCFQVLPFILMNFSIYIWWFFASIQTILPVPFSRLLLGLHLH